MVQPESERSEAARRFTLADGMILIGGVSIGLLVLRSRYFAHWTRYGPLVWEPGMVAMAISDGLLWSTLGLFAVRFRLPRPEWREMRRQPGLIGCVALWLVFVYRNLSLLPHAIWRSVRSGAKWDWENLIGLLSWNDPLLSVLGVAVAWITLVIAGAWCPERSWVDRLGRLICVVFIVLGVVRQLDLSFR